jgi:small membrane protein
MIKIPLILGLAFFAFYGWRQRRISPAIGYAMPLVSLLGIALVIRPEWAQAAAGLLGIGRGADLVLYVWTVVSLLLLANLHFRLRGQSTIITTLTRELAILEARQRDG